jgi:hypothetical protein
VQKSSKDKKPKLQKSSIFKTDSGKKTTFQVGKQHEMDATKSFDYCLKNTPNELRSPLK